MPLNPTFKHKGHDYPADAVLAVVPKEDGVEVRFATRGPARLMGASVEEVLAKIEAAKFPADSDPA